MENIYEKCVVKQRDIKDNLVVLFSVLGVVVLSVVAWLIEPVRNYSFAVFAVSGFVAYMLITNRNIEYEYILAGDSISMDKILNRRKRKSLLSCDLNDFDIVARVLSKDYQQYSQNVAKTINAVSGENKEAEFFAITEYKNKRTMLILELDERAINHFKKHIDFKLKI